MGVTEQLARFAVDVPRSAVPAAAVESAKLRFVDTLAVMIAGSRHPSALISLEVARQIGGNPVASIVGHRDRTSSPLAGHVNAVSAHALEYDDYTKSVTHASVCMVPGSLALAEQLDKSGADLLDAFIVGFEIESCVAKGLRPFLIDHGWHPNGILGAMGVAAAGARLMRLDQMSDMGCAAGCSLYCSPPPASRWILTSSRDATMASMAMIDSAWRIHSMASATTAWTKWWMDSAIIGNWRKTRRSCGCTPAQRRPVQQLMA
jgi:hypothetical protein